MGRTPASSSWNTRKPSVIMSIIDISIIGYGPVGALTALSLANAGLRVRILERSPDPVEMPRAVAIDGETLRAFQRLDRSNEIWGLCQLPRDLNTIAFANSKRVPIISLDILGFGANGWPDMTFFDQPELEAELRRLVALDDRIEVKLGNEVVRIDQDAESVTITSRDREDGGETKTVSRYSIGCDGASSFVRETVGIEWLSLDYDQEWLVIDITQGPDADLPLTTMQICDPARLATYICVKDPNRRWEFQLLPGETREEILSDEKIGELLSSWIDPKDYEIRRAAVYQFHAATAEKWRAGRVLLAGDAAHQTPPFLGQGLNAGFRDAVNLGWKLPLVLSGVCGDDLLDTYAVERDPHARDLVDRAVSIGKLMEVLAAREAGEPDPHPPESLNVNVGGPIVPPMRGGVMIQSQTETGKLAGKLLRQPRVRARKAEGDNEDILLDHFLGKSFCVVGRETNDLALGDEAKTILEQLGGSNLALTDLEVTEGRFDSLFEEHAAVLVRPDRYIFGVTDKEWSLDQLVLELGKKLSFTG